MRVHRIQGVMAASYLIETQGGLYLVDAGFLGTGPLVRRAIRYLGRSLRELRLVLITHPHLDHFGGLPALHERGSFEIVAHPGATRAVAEGGKEFSPGHTPFSRWVAWLAATSLPHLKFRGAGPVRGLGDGESLHALGLPGRVLHTPGHTSTCVSLLLDDGTALTGDLVQGANPFVRRPSAPTMAWDLGAAAASWRRLLDAGLTRARPAHGSSLTAAELASVLRRTETRLAGT